MEHSMYISFRIKKSKTNKKGLAPINMRIILDNKRFEISSHRFVLPENWDTKLCSAKGTSDEALILNNYLDNLKSKINRQYNILESLNKPITIDSLRERLTGQGEKKYSLLFVYEYHNSEMEKRVNFDIAPATYSKYIISFNRIKNYIQYQYGKKDILLESLNHAFITKYEVYLKTIHKCSTNTTVKYLVHLKKIINLSIANEWLLRDPFMKHHCTYKPTERGFLSPEELLLLENKELKLPRLQKVRDIFVFCCYTGFAQADVEALSPSDITTGIDGEKWIIINRKKTDGRSPIPLLPQAMDIINKYKNDPEAQAKGRLLPVNSNQRMNGYLKEIADITGITKNLTMHLARHTFATTITLSNGVPIETVSKMLGHNSIKTTQIYSKVVDTKISNDMQALKAKLSIQNPLKKVM
ncbi:MAG: recombinase [Bacteroidetes bacterium HGW-Bacteroidetes-16]|nr:MAG: recombinase [Bacteroidetes bacterium HGW-Bacteroidetes-16]